MGWTIAITVLLTVIAMTVAMNFKTPEKKLERKIEHRYAVADPQFRREMGVLLGPGIVPGNRVTDLENGDEIFPAMLQAIQGATRTITFETYIYWSGDIGAKFADALAERARAGVKVKVMLDWVGSLKMDDAQLQRMRDAGVDIHQYRPLKWYNLGRLNNRTHRKLLVVDGKLGFTGGVGVADQWEGHAQDPDHWRDLHFRIEGPVVAQLQAAFNDNWIKTTGEVLNGADYFPALAPVGTTGARMWQPAAQSLSDLIAAAKADGVTIGVTEGYRSYDEQVSLAKTKGLYSQGGLAAQPGTSEHGWGIAADLKLDSAGLAWMKANASRYGFVADTPRESWHWAYHPSTA